MSACCLLHVLLPPLPPRITLFNPSRMDASPAHCGPSCRVCLAWSRQVWTSLPSSGVGSGVELFAGCPGAVSHRGFPTALLECASHPLRPERVMVEGVTEDLSSRPSDGGPNTADRLGGPRWRGTLFLWLLYFFGLWLFDNSSKNSL